MKELLLLLCRYPFDSTDKETLSGLLGEVKGWHSMVNLINAHGIIALAAYNIKEAGLEKQIPPEAMAFLENGYRKSLVRNTWLTECWKEVNIILNDAGIQHILLKGMDLEHTLYGSRGLRQMNDNDILIKPGESVKAWNLLQKKGFTPEPLKSPLLKKIMFDLGQHLPTLYKNGYALEIHEKLFDLANLNSESKVDPFNNLEQIMIGETKAFILSKELNLMYLENHFKLHAIAGDCQLRLFNDIILLNRFNSLKMPDHFISDPMQGNKEQFRKAAYKTRISSINPKYRFMFILGDTFPSLKWMQNRYNCSVVKAVLHYPIRIGKLLWLIN
jgi:hypothetical protein